MTRKDTVERFEFMVTDDRLIGDLYLPDGVPRGVIVTTGPLTSVRRQASGAYARAMSQRGFAAVSFDHRGFGDSSGSPRQFESPERKIEDIRVAVAALSQRIPSTPIVAVAICAGAGYMAWAVADEPAIKAFVGVAGYYSHPSTESLAAAAAQIARAKAAETEWQRTGTAEMIPAVSENGGDVAMPMREAYQYYGTPRGQIEGYVNAFAVQSRAYTILFDAAEAAPRITVPTMLIHSDNALAPSLARVFFDRLSVPRTLIWTKSQGQIDFYDDHPLIAYASDAIEHFLSAELGL